MLRRKLPDDTAVLQGGRAEVEEHSASEIRTFKVVHDLGLLDGPESVECFDLHEHRAEADKIRAIAEWQRPLLVTNRDRNLVCELERSRLELHRQGGSIDSFEVTTSELAVDFHRCANDRVGLWVCERLARAGGHAVVRCMDNAVWEHA